MTKELSAVRRVPKKGSTHDRKSHARPQERPRPKATTQEHSRILVLARKIVIEGDMRKVWPITRSPLSWVWVTSNVWGYY